MSKLILPPHIVRQRRSHVEIPLQEILDELVARGILFELAAESRMPPPEQLAEMNLADDQVEALRQQVFAELFQKAGEALRTSNLAFTGRGYQPPITNEVLVVKICVLRHPMIPAPQPAPANDPNP